MFGDSSLVEELCTGSVLHASAASENIASAPISSHAVCFRVFCVIMTVFSSGFPWCQVFDLGPVPVLVFATNRGSICRSCSRDAGRSLFVPSGFESRRSRVEEALAHGSTSPWTSKIGITMRRPGGSCGRSGASADFGRGRLGRSIRRGLA